MRKETKMTWTKETVRELLTNRDDAVINGMIRIYDLQTEGEKSTMETEEQNGVGFNSVDGHILSSFVEFHKKTGFITPKQMKLARKKMLKYSGQLLKIIENKA